MSRSSAYISLPGETRDEHAHLVSPDEDSGYPDTTYSSRNASKPARMPGRAGEGYSLSTLAPQTNKHGESMAQGTAIRFLSKLTLLIFRSLHSIHSDNGLRVYDFREGGT